MMRILQKSLVNVSAALFLARLTYAADWSVTSYYELSYSVSVNTQYGYSYTRTQTLTVLPGVTPTASPLSHIVNANSWNDAGFIATDSVFFPLGGVPSDKVTTLLSGYRSVYTDWVSPVTYTAPPSCPTPFTFATYSAVNIPTAIWDQLTPTSTSTQFIAGNTTYISAYLTPSALPPKTTSSIDYYYTAYIAKCSVPGSAGSMGGGNNNSNSDSNSSSYKYCPALVCTTVKKYVIILATVIPGLFLIGFFESYFWFRRLMLGKGCLRLGTVCWILISLWLICITRIAHERSKDDRVALQERWEKIPFGTRLKLWLRWGFRLAYPTDILGPTQDTGGDPSHRQQQPYYPHPADPSLNLQAHEVRAFEMDPNAHPVPSQGLYHWSNKAEMNEINYDEKVARRELAG